MGLLVHPWKRCKNKIPQAVWVKRVLKSGASFCRLHWWSHCCFFLKKYFLCSILCTLDQNTVCYQIRIFTVFLYLVLNFCMILVMKAPSHPYDWLEMICSCGVFTIVFCCGDLDGIFIWTGRSGCKRHVYTASLLVALDFLWNIMRLVAVSEAETGNQ